MLPFFGTCHIGYIPGAKVLGLSKFSKVVNAFSTRFQIQERLTQELTEFF
jgi:GTP cyclohydrolase IA